MNKSRKAGCALILCVCLCLSGCGSSPNAMFENSRVSVSSVSNTQDTVNTSMEYLSKDICVIPKNGQTQPKSSFMTAKAALMINDSDQKMLYSQNIYKRVYPASITKIVTALVALKYGNLSDTVTISYNASHITEYGAKLCGFQEGDKIVLKDLLYSFLICSGNDAGIAIAEHIAGDVDSFAKMMNKEMKAIGAVHSHFVNPHGLHDKKHYTTAYDLYLVFHKLIQNETFLDIIHQPGYTAKFTDKNNKSKSLYFLSTDRYLIGRATPPSGVTVIGGKTGTTSDAGSCLILYSKGSDNKDYISVVLKAPGAYDLYAQMNYLLGFAAK
ncbi:MAG: serine hydrolase [Butyribacter sp.]|nr:serine hydrolase [bacterium]MDY3853510.1 serine hydrolase [Butyribacter sp.]